MELNNIMLHSIGHFHMDVKFIDLCTHSGMDYCRPLNLTVALIIIHPTEWSLHVQLNGECMFPVDGVSRCDTAVTSRGAVSLYDAPL